MKFLIHSNGPNVKTGYGVQVGLLVDRLARDGHQVAVSSTYGHQPNCGPYEWVSPSGHKIPVFPYWRYMSGDDVICAHARQWFGQDEGWIIPLTDVWVLKSPGLRDFNVAGWAPVDHDPVPEMVLEFFARSNATCLAMSRHGEAQFAAAGLPSTYIPLAVDTKAYKPTPFIDMDGRKVTGREFLDVDETVFLVGMVGMNKDPNDRKAFSEAFQAFSEFHRMHPNSILHVHTEKNTSGGGLDLSELAQACGIPETAIQFTNQYAYVFSFSPEQMALMYTAFDVLLAPSVGEGFCVPLIEAQACGTPVIASNFTAQPELVGAGWLVRGQKWWDAASHSWYQRPDVFDIVRALDKAYTSDKQSDKAVKFAAQYDADHVYDTYWRPFIASLDTRPPAVKPPMERVAVLVPAMNRPHNVDRLVDSFNLSNDGSATLYYVLDADDAPQIAAVEAKGLSWLPATKGTSFASKVNAGYEQTTEDFVFLCGDDVEFTPGWIQAARDLSDRYDVIGTNDTADRVRNPKVAAGKHADHFFVRRTYVEDEGASLEGPGILAPEAYYHFFVDVEMIQLAKARGVFTPCLQSVVIHHHPGFDGREDLRQADKAYMKAVEFSEMDSIAFNRRRGLIDQHKVVKGDIWS